MVRLRRGGSDSKVKASNVAFVPQNSKGSIKAGKHWAKKRIAKPLSQKPRGVPEQSWPKGEPNLFGVYRRYLSFSYIRQRLPAPASALIPIEVQTLDPIKRRP